MGSLQPLRAIDSVIKTTALIAVINIVLGIGSISNSHYDRIVIVIILIIKTSVHLHA